MKIGVVGAGLVGRFLSWRLANAGEKVDVFEKSSRSQHSSAAHVAASMLAPCSERIESSQAIWDLGINSLNSWKKILGQMQVPHGMDGSVVVSHASEHKLLQKFQSVLKNRYGIQDIQTLNRKELEKLEPGLSRSFQYGVFLPTEGWLDNRILLAQLEDSPARFCYDTPKNPEELRSDYEVVIDCRGVAAMVDDPDLRAVRGEVIRVHAPDVDLMRPIRLMHPKYQIYICPRQAHEYVIGATQIESSSTADPTVQSVLELLSAAYSVHSGFAEAEIIELASGLRAAYPDNEPRIQWRGSVLRVNGLYRHGYLIAPALSEQVISEVENTWTLSSTATA